jgi:nucleoside-diphosphate-sugar epimerase
VYGTGEQTRDFTYIDDVVNAIEISVNLPPTNDVFNISTMEETSVKRIVDIISTYIPNVSLEYVEGRSIDGITRRCLDNTKAKKILEWSPSVSIVEGIESMINVYIL